MKCIQEYITRTKPLRKDETQLLISFVKPHKAVSKDTIGRWTESVLANAGIDTSQFGAHRLAQLQLLLQKEVVLIWQPL